VLFGLGWAEVIIIALLAAVAVLLVCGCVFAQKNCEADALRRVLGFGCFINRSKIFVLCCFCFLFAMG
jgi:hypothetical protein